MNSVTVALANFFLGQLADLKGCVQLLQVAVEVGGAMAYLHPQVVHRDLKSQNVVFGQDKAKVCDFGIAKFKER